MNKKNRHYFLKRFFLLVTLTTFAAIIILFFLSISISLSVFNSMNKNDIKPYMEAGQELVIQYNEGTYTGAELQEILNPKVDMGSGFLILIDTKNNIIAASETGLALVDMKNIPAITAAMQTDKYWSVSEEGQTPSIYIGNAVRKDGQIVGYVLAGKNLGRFASAANQYKYNLLLALLPVLVCVLIPGYIASRRLSKPTDTLTKAALQLAGGDLHVKIEQKLKGEMGEIASAFNYMSEKLSETIYELQYQKDSIEFILEGLSEGIIAMNHDCEVVRENGAVLKLFGSRDSKEYHFIKNELENSIAEQAPRQGKINTQQGVLLYSITSILKENNFHIGAVALIRDITENERLEKTRHDYVANISHELRTPLSSMRGLIEGLRDGLVTKQTDKERYYSILSNEVLRLSRLVNDLLELSGLQASTAAFELEKIDCREMMLELHDRYKKMFEEKHLEFILTFYSEEYPRILSNEDRLTQVLTIFLDNAIKYTPEEGKVVLGAEKTDKGVRFFVKDSGRGMDKQTAEKIFDRFYQAEVSRSEKGNGLGLSIAKEILDKLQIEVHVASEPEQGSEFWFTVPV